MLKIIEYYLRLCA